MSAPGRTGPGPEGPRLRLRPPRDDEIPLLYGWYNDPELVAPFDRFALDTPEGFEEALRSAEGDEASLAPRRVIATREADRAIGFVGHYVSHPVLASLEVWYVLGASSERGKGYGTEAVRLLVDDLFHRRVIQRVGATCDVANLPSVRLLEHLGFRLEGTLQQVLFHHAAWHDVRVYGITRSEWRGPPGG